MRDGETYSRRELLSACGERFHLGERKVGEMIADEKAYFVERQDGHEKTFQLDIGKALKAPWAQFFFGMVTARK